MKKFSKRSAMLLPAMAMAALVQTPASAAEGPRVGEDMAVVEMVWEQRGPEEVAKRAQSLAEVMLGTTPEVDLSAGKTDELMGRWTQAFVDHPGLRLKYLPDYDELRIINLDLLDGRDQGVDVGERGALELAAKYLAEFADRGLVDPRHYSLDKAQLGYGMVGEGSIDGRSAGQRIVEYRVTLRREINGIELANAGVRLSIHASGQLAGVRIGGVTALTRTVDGRELPTGKGQMVTRKVSGEAIEERFRKRTTPPGTEAQVLWQRLMYVMPENARQALVAPQEVYAYTLHGFADGVAPVVSRRQIMGYSVVDPAAAPVDFTAPGQVQEDQKARQR